MGTNLSKVSFKATNAPRMKRATATLSDGTAVAIVPDQNFTTTSGADDVSGTFKFRIYKSDVNRTTWTLNGTWTPATPGGSATVACVCSMVLDSANNMHLVYQGTNNALFYKYFPYSAGSWSTAGTIQTVVAANSVGNRFRAVDIDVPNAGTAANVAIIAYESKATNGPSAWITVYARRNDGVTWDNTYTEDQATLPGGSNNIYPSSEDVSLSWNAAGISGNVGQILFYANRTGLDYDRGEQVRELQWNTLSGGSASILGTWPMMNQDIGTPFRRGWVFKTANNIWQVATCAGVHAPKFSVMRLSHGQFGPPFINSFGTGWWSFRPAPMRPTIEAGINPGNFIACSYSDDRVFFGFITLSTPIHAASYSNWSLAGLVFRYDNSSVFWTSYNDRTVRPLDNYFQDNAQYAIGLYGAGNNRNQAGDFKFNFLGLYANQSDSNDVTTLRYILDTFYDPPTIVGPASFVANNSPTLQVRVQNSALYPNVKGKIEWQLARDSNFTSDLRTIAEPDSNYRYFGSTTASTPPPIPVSLTLSGKGNQKLYSGVWYMRARVVSDLGQSSSWTNYTWFTVYHPPSALPATPTPGSLNEYGMGNMTFAWRFSDTEPTDNQSAYQLMVQRADNGSTVYDSGKVISSAQSATITLVSTHKDVPLQWSVLLWDSDDQEGSFSNPTIFTISDSPKVKVTSPANGATVTSAAPMVTWTFLGGGARTQDAYRVYIQKLDVMDTFVRASVPNGWGAANNGSSWTVDAGSASLYSTDGSVGIHQHEAAAARKRIAVGPFVTDSVQRVSATVPIVAVGAPIDVALMARRIDSNTYYFGGARFNTDGTVSVYISRRVGGSGNETEISTINTGQIYTAGSSWNVNLTCIGNQLQVKTWPAENQEPTFGYGLTVTDNSIRVAGTGGITSMFSSASTNAFPQNITFDNYKSYEPQDEIIADSGWIKSNASSHSFASNILENTSYYDVIVLSQDNKGLQSSSTAAIETSWIHPALGDGTVTTDDFGAIISWTEADIDMNFVSWRVYRRYMVTSIPELDDENTASVWTLVYETADPAGPFTFKDYLIPIAKDVDYVVVQVADRFGSLIESDITSWVTVRMTADRYYFIPGVPIGTIASYEAGSVTDDSWTDETERETLHVIGRGRQVQVGDDLGANGTLTIQCRGQNARTDREFIKRLASSKTINVWVKNPFGDVKYVRFGDIGVTLLSGTGTTEMSDLTVPYTEVFAPPVVTRII